MIVTEFYMTRRDGVKLYRSYSDDGFYIERDGEMYEEAIDPEGVERTYNETTEPVPAYELTAEEALAIITGGEV